MNDMKCIDCVLKHLSAALSYGKEVLSGHGLEAQLDHRIDFLGQLVNAEHHLSILDQRLFKFISSLRKQIQKQNSIPTFDNLQTIRIIFRKTQNIQIVQPIVTEKNYIDFEPDIIYYSISNSQYVDFSQQTVKKYLKDYNRIFRVDSEHTLEQILSIYDLSKTVLFVPQRFIMLKQFSAKRFYPLFSNDGKKNYDNLVAELVQVDKMKQIVSDKDYSNCLTRYFEANKPQYQNFIQKFCKGVDKHICCSLKRALDKQNFTYWINLEGYQEVKKYLNNPK